jgi:hypothetical protein
MHNPERWNVNSALHDFSPRLAILPQRRRVNFYFGHSYTSSLEKQAQGIKMAHPTGAPFSIQTVLRTDSTCFT